MREKCLKKIARTQVKQKPRHRKMECDMQQMANLTAKSDATLKERERKRSQIVKLLHYAITGEMGDGGLIHNSNDVLTIWWINQSALRFRLSALNCRRFTSSASDGEDLSPIDCGSCRK